MHMFMFRNPSDDPVSVKAYHPTPVQSSQLRSPRLQWARIDSNHDTLKITHEVQPLIAATGVKMKM